VSAPPLVTTSDRPFIVRVEAFSGPLDLLLHLIRQQEIEITDIPIAEIADQFLEAIDVLGLNEAADYLEMAARLLQIKVQMLLPRPFDEEDWDDPRAELVRRLLEYEQVRELASWLSKRAEFRAERFARGWTPPLSEPAPPPLVLELADLLAAVQEVLDAMPEPVVHRVIPRPLDVEGAARRITALIAERGSLDFRELFETELPNPADVISALIAVLELARIGQLLLNQRQPFGPLTITREASYATA
jgi:segregation and condensation protein A